MNGFHVKLTKCSASDLIATVDDGIGQMMERVSIKATERINNTVVTDRRRVHVYYPLLWVWHRLDEPHGVFGIRNVAVPVVNQIRAYW